MAENREINWKAVYQIINPPLVYNSQQPGVYPLDKTQRVLN